MTAFYACLRELFISQKDKSQANLIFSGTALASHSIDAQRRLGAYWL
jgi:hypothetical protein